MKTIFLIICTLTCSAISPTIATATDTATLGDDQMAVLIDGTVLPLVQSYSSAAKEGSSFDVVIVQDAVLRKKLSERYVKFSKWLKFEPEDAVVFKNKVYIDKASNREVYVNRFNVVSHKENKFVVRWNRVFSSVSGVTKKVTITFFGDKWIISNIELEAVS